MINQLRDRKFDYIGGLYFRWAVDHGPQKLDNTAELDTLLIILAVTKSPTADIESPNDVNQDESKPSASGDSAGGEDAKVVLLQSTASVTLFGRSEEVKQKNSGIEKIQVQREWFKNGPIEEDEDYGGDFAEEAPMMKRLCHDYLEILPTVFGDEEKKDSFILHNSNLNAANILEMVDVTPEWKATEYPKFCNTWSPKTQKSPQFHYTKMRAISPGTSETAGTTETLRRHFNDVMKRLTGDDAIDDTLKTKAKRDCYELLPELTGMWN
ncbi:MAG: hypothetical protein ALECFALPRED_002682 [Alectoria fallacina]|uniref:Uncharacterized protein n=1 Tax=Alectoria fallacina TaxID=1903189 RepID=A0A8H3FDQ0_9LECA|nr:MAG: hypothetical protein ALECFALPRED_002682 [Alectoria fallacina]